VRDGRAIAICRARERGSREKECENTARPLLAFPPEHSISDPVFPAFAMVRIRYRYFNFDTGTAKYDCTTIAEFGLVAVVERGLQDAKSRLQNEYITSL
jgi:hypothetical protein